MNEHTNKAGRTGKTNKVTVAVLMLVSLLITFAALELGVRAWLRFFATKNQIALYGSVEQVLHLPKKYARHHYLPFIPTPSFIQGHNRHNSLGFRGEELQVPKPDGTFRIALLGGSTTYSHAIEDYRKSYPYVLQSILREGNQSIEVLNAGVGRYSTWESLLNLILRVQDTEPDIVIVYHGINDVHPRLTYPFEAYRGDNSGARAPYSPPYEKGLMQSALFRWAATRFGLRKPIAGLLYTRTHDWLPTNFTMAFRKQKRNNTYPSGIFEKVPAAQMLSQNRPIYFKRNLENIIAICRFHGIDIVLMTFASSPDFPDHPLTSSSEYQSAFEEQNNVVRELCRKHNVYCYDFADDMPRDPRYWTDGRHLTEEGILIKAQLVANYLRKSRLVPSGQDGSLRTQQSAPADAEKTSR